MFDLAVDIVHTAHTADTAPTTQTAQTADRTDTAGAAARLVPLPDGLVVEPIVATAATARFDLALNTRDRGAGDALELALTYARDRFVDATAERLLDDYVALVAQIAADPSRRVADLAASHAQAAARETIPRGPFLPAHRRVADRASMSVARRVAVRRGGAELWRTR